MSIDVNTMFEVLEGAGFRYAIEGTGQLHTTDNHTV